MEPIPLPATVPDPPPEYLRRKHVLACFVKWGVGGEFYLKRKVQEGELHAVPRPPLVKSPVYRTAEVMAIYRKMKAEYIRQVLK